MVKLRDAKCPNCGANIEVNEELEKSICQYCGSTVIIEEAIQKYQIEVSGNVQVEGIKGRTTKLIQAKKHIEIDELDQGHRLLLDIVEEDPFDVEAFSELVKLYVIKLEKGNFDETSSRITDPDGWALLDELNLFYDRIQKIDKKKESEKVYGDKKEKVHSLIELLEKEGVEAIDLENLVSRLRVCFEKARKISDNCGYKWFREIAGEFWGIKSVIINVPKDTNLQSVFREIIIEKITRDGVLCLGFKEGTTLQKMNPKVTVPIVSKKIESIDKIKEILDEIEAKTEPFIEEQRQKEIKDINSSISKNKLKNIILFIIIIVLAIIIILCVKKSIDMIRIGWANSDGETCRFGIIKTYFCRSICFHTSWRYYICKFF